MLDNLNPDAERAIEFMSWLNPAAPMYLEHMRSDGPPRPTAKPYPAHDGASAKRFVTANNGDDLRRNMYWLPNSEFLSGKRLKANLTAARFLHVDLDCKDYPGTEGEQSDRIIGLLLDERERPKGIPSPSAVWFTGGGYQAVWRMAESIGIEQAEQLNRALLAALQGGPGTHDPSRLLRLPGTVNWLNDKKRKDGRTPARAYVLEPANFGAPPADYTIGDFKLRVPKETAPATLSQGTATVDADALEPLPLPDDLGEILPPDPDWTEAIVTGNTPPGKSYKTRSELVFAAAIWMLSRKVNPGHVLSIITSRDFGISAHVFERPSPMRYAQRQVGRAMEVIAARGGGWPMVDEHGRPKANRPENVRFALAMLGVDSQRNLFTQTDEITGFDIDDRDIGEVGDILCSVFARKLDLSCEVPVIRRELIAIAHEKAYHPVIDYLDGLVWDGKPRLDTMLRDYAGADDTELNREFGAKFLIAGVRRVREPGVKFDTMLVFEGNQGTGKSSFAEILAVNNDWFCGSLSLRSDDKTKAELLAGSWIVEVQEMDGIRKASTHELKRFLSTRRDKYRRAYGRDAQTYPRQCVIVGSTNDQKYLFDQTGNRRFWPVRAGTVNLDKLREDVDQLWAEAVVREEAGESIVLSEHLWDSAAELTDLRLIEDAFATVLSDWFGDKTGRVSMDSVKLLLGFEGGRLSPIEVQRIKAEMDRLGWEEKTNRLHDLSQREKTQRRGFARGTQEERKTEWLARRVENGVVTLFRIDDSASENSPF